MKLNVGYPAGSSAYFNYTDAWRSAGTVEGIALCSFRLNSAHLISPTVLRPSETLVVIDYLQLLDQKRENPSLSEPVPGLANVRPPNPVDMTLFNKSFFLNNGEMRVALST